MIDLDQTPPAPPAPPPRRRRRWLRWLLVVLLLAGIGLGSAAGYVVWGMGGEPGGRRVTVEIPEGASGSQIAARLEDQKVIRSALVFRLLARIRGVDTSLKPGVYEMRTGLGVGGVIDLLQKGIEPEFVRVTIPEGKTLVEVARIVAETTHIGEDAFLREARSGRHRLAIMPRGSTNLEGLLFPKAYDVTEEMSAGQLIDRMLDQFRAETASLAFGRARALGITPYEAVVVASLIEREARAQVDRPLVSSVIYNRLRRGMRLQIDATVQYAILLRTGSYKQPLTTDDYTRWRSPFNTYLIDGLPPSPIAAPGLPALRAALSPARTDYLYYRLSNDGVTHCFGRDASEHAACADK